MTQLTQHKLKSLVKYNKHTGLFTKLGYPSIGYIYGSSGSKENYVKIAFNRECWQAHRLAFLYVVGRWPNKFIDHINGIKSDNRWCNLRECTHSQNLANSGKRKTNTSGYKGVSWNTRDEIWMAAISHKGKLLNLGSFDDPHEAALTYNERANEIYGEFAYLNEVTL